MMIPKPRRWMKTVRKRMARAWEPLPEGAPRESIARLYTPRVLRRASFLVLVVLLVASLARAEEALVLSGGGARGLAHVGVVQGVERRGHDPGIVVGTSMGSIVGALYAAGYDPPTIRAILENEDWRAIFTSFPIEVGPDRSLRYPILRFQAQGKGSFGTRAYIPDWRINRYLTHLLFDPAARARGNFDRLPRRFRSVTADAETGELVPLGSGDLARAVRVSMAAAGFFAPVRWGGRYLTDGGIADYLPVAVARRMGGDPVIASDVLWPPPRLLSVDAIAVARRSTELLAIRARREPVPPEVMIRPAVDPALAPFDYPVDPAPVIDAGLISTLAALPESETGPPAARIIAREPASLSALEVADGGLSETPDTRMLPFLRRAFRGVAPAPYRAHRVLRLVDRLYATGLFDGVWPSVEDSAGMAAPVLRVKAESRGPSSLSGGVGFDNDRGGRIWMSFRRLDAVGARPVEVALEGAANGVDQWAAASARMSSLALGAAAWTAGANFGETEIRRQHLPGDPGDIEVRRAGGWLGVETRWLDPEIHVAAAMRAEGIDSDFGPEGGAYGPWLRVSGVAPLVQVVGTSRSVEVESRFGEVEYRRARAK